MKIWKTMERSGWEAMTEVKKRRELDMELEAPADFTSPEELYEELVRRIQRYHPSDDLSMIEKAYKVADSAHQGQKRKSGEAYIIDRKSVV